jgi:hypothetical protein
VHKDKIIADKEKGIADITAFKDMMIADKNKTIAAQEKTIASLSDPVGRFCQLIGAECGDSVVRRAMLKFDHSVSLLRGARAALR